MALNLEKLKVLVVDDVDPIQQLIAKIVNTIGVEQLYTANNGEEAFDLFCKVNADIILTDWHMPDCNGIDFIKKVRTSDYSPNKMVPIIMITGYSAPTRIATCRDEGSTEFIAKPFTAENLIQKINHVIQKPRDFIDCEDFFGPDRRRNRGAKYQGPYRRESDQRIIV
ncbi:MAG: response regulator [Alcanivorax sp.]